MGMENQKNGDQFACEGVVDVEAVLKLQEKFCKAAG